MKAFMTPAAAVVLMTAAQTQSHFLTKRAKTTYTENITHVTTFPTTIISGYDLAVPSAASTTEALITASTTRHSVVTNGTRAKDVPTALLPVAAATTSASPTKITVCPKLTGLYAPLDSTSNLTFGCYPGTVCTPAMPKGCNVWAGPPSDDFLCPARDCLIPLSTTAHNWKGNDPAYNPRLNNYFNLDPTEFGLSYEAFNNYENQKPRVLPSNQSRLLAPQQFSTPLQCFDQCNTAYIIAETEGKTDTLCRDKSDFRAGLDLCQQCIQIHGDISLNVADENVSPVFAQFVNFCNGRRSTPAMPKVESPLGLIDPLGPESEVISQPMESSTQASAVSGGFEPASSTTSAAEFTASTTREAGFIGIEKGVPVPAPTDASSVVAVSSTAPTNDAKAKPAGSFRGAPSSKPRGRPSPADMENGISHATDSISDTSSPSATDSTTRTASITPSARTLKLVHAASGCVVHRDILSTVMMALVIFVIF